MKVTREIIKRIDALESALRPKPMIFRYYDAEGQEHAATIEELEAAERAGTLHSFGGVVHAGRMKDLSRYLAIVRRYAEKAN